MKILKDLIDKSEDTLEEVEWYAEKSLILKMQHRQLADLYNKLAEIHINIYEMMHQQMVAIIDEYRKTGQEVPAQMQAIWEYKHKELVKHFAELKVMVDEYKQMVVAR